MKKAALTILILAAFTYLYSANLKDMGKIQDITGKVYGKLTVISFSHSNSLNNFWNCKCECGELSVRKAGNLNYGYHGCRACGKYKRHGMYLSMEYRTWNCMLNRCKSNYKFTAYYSEKGITVCDRWHKFENFFEDMGPRPTPEHSIDRIENDKGYYKENCRWATDLEQGNNKTNNIFIEYNGEKLSMAQWGVKTGFKEHVISWRLKKGWSPERIINTPVRFKKPNHA